MLKIGDKKYYINKKKGTVAAVATSWEPSLLTPSATLSGRRSF